MIVNPTVPTTSKEFQKAKSASQKVILAYLNEHPELSKQEVENIDDKFSFDFECYEVKELGKYRTSQAEDDYKQMLEGMREYTIIRIADLSERIRPEDGCDYFYNCLAEAIKDGNCDKHLRYCREEDYYYELSDAVDDLLYLAEFGGVALKPATIDDVSKYIS